MPGRVVAVHTAAGAKVKKDQVLVSVEAMKMEHEITVPKDALVRTVHVQPGDQVEAGTVLVELDEVS